MSSINLAQVGLGSGIQWSLIIDHELQQFHKYNIAPLQERQDSIETKVSALSSLRSEMTELMDVSESMNTPSELRAMTAESSDEDVIGVSAESGATAGTHEVTVNQLADSEIETHTGVDDASTVINNSGGVQQFTYTYDDQSITLNVQSGATLENLRDLINNDQDNPGVTASILDDGSGSSSSHHLVLRGSETGKTYGITIDDGQTTLQGDWANLTADAGAGSGTLNVDATAPFAQYQAVLVGDDDSGSEVHIVDTVGAGSLTLRNTLSSAMTTGQNAYVTPRGMGDGVASATSAGTTEISVTDASKFQEGKSIVVADGTGSEELTIASVDTASDIITVEEIGRAHV